VNINIGYAVPQTGILNL